MNAIPEDFTNIEQTPEEFLKNEIRFIEIFKIQDEADKKIAKKILKDEGLKIGVKAAEFNSIYKTYQHKYFSAHKTEVSEIDILELGEKHGYIYQDENGQKLITAKLSKYLMSKDDYITHGSLEHPRMYKNGYYDNVPECRLQKHIRQHIPDTLNTNKNVSETLKHLLDSSNQDKGFENEVDLLDLVRDTDKKYLNVQNGLLDLETFELEEHSPDKPSFTQIKASYDPSAQNGNSFNAWLNFVTAGDEQENMKKALQEWVGYGLSAWSKHKGLLFLTGPKDTGKSMFLSLFNLLLPEHAITNFDLQDLDEDEKKAHLFNSRLNTSADLSNNKISDVGTIKALTGGGNDKITARFLYKSSFSFAPYTKIISACNELPPVYRHIQDKAFVDRITIIPFLNVVPQEKIDPNLIKKFESEKIYILNWAIEGLKRLVSNSFKFTELNSSQAFKEQYVKENSTVLTFIDECCIKEGNSTSSELYEHYKEWCTESSLPSRSVQNFRKELENLGRFEFKKRVRSTASGKVSSGYEGIRYAPEAHTEGEESGNITHLPIPPGFKQMKLEDSDLPF